MKTKKRKIMGWTFVIPASIMIVIFNFVPMIQSFILSLKRGSGTNMTFTGISNYKRMFQDKIFKMTLSNTFIYLILEVAIMLVIAMFLASLLNDKRLKGKWFFRLAIFLPGIVFHYFSFSFLCGRIHQYDSYESASDCISNQLAGKYLDRTNCNRTGIIVEMDRL